MHYCVPKCVVARFGSDSESKTAGKNPQDMVLIRFVHKNTLYFGVRMNNVENIGNYNTV